MTSFSSRTSQHPRQLHIILLDPKLMKQAIKDEYSHGTAAGRKVFFDDITMIFCRAFTVAVLATVVCLSIAQFNIPLPFGGLTFNKNPDGQVEVGVNQNVNILGWGGNRGLKITGGNGTFQTETEGGILANGTNFGANSTFGVDKEKGVKLDSDLNVGNDTVKGGVGKESSFISGLTDLINKKKEENKKP